MYYCLKKREREEIAIEKFNINNRNHKYQFIDNDVEH